MEENKCIVKNCESTSKNLFCSPPDEEMLKKWQESVETDENYFLVCEKHFAAHDICIEKILEQSAVPSLDIVDENSEVDQESCGMCLEKCGDNKFKIGKQGSDYFKTITGYKPVKEDICENCEKFLQNYEKFKTEVKEKHKKLKSQEIQDESEDDCLMVAVDNSNDKSCPQAPIVEIHEGPQKLVYPKLPPEIVTKVVEPTKNVKTLYTCKHCYFKTTETISLISHIDINHYFPCEQCPFISSNKPLLTLHINKVHTKDRTTIICGICDKRFEHKSLINEHYEATHNSPTSSFFMCFYCKTNCNDEEELKNHYKKFHTSGKTTADDQISNTKLQLALLIGKKERISDKIKARNYDDLMRRVTGNSSVTVKKISKKKKKKKAHDDFVFEIPINTPIKIPNFIEEPKKKPPITEVTIISKNSSNNQYLEEKVDAESDSDVEMTTVEDDAISISSSEDDTYEVVGLSEPTNKQLLQAKYKSLTFESSIKISQVQSIPANDIKNAFRCFSCNEYYDNVISLLEHREKAHPPEDTSKEYEDIHKSKLAFKIERKKPATDEGLSKVICDICLKYIKESNLEKHKQLRHTEKQFLCHYCSRTFADQTSFRYHMMKHEPDSLYQCDMCDRGYVTKGRLERHIRKFHLKIPQIRAVCSICNKRLYKNESKPHVLKKHMEKYHPDGKDEGYRVNEETNYYDCEKCGASYWDLYTLKKHSCEKGKLQLRCLDCMMPCGSAESLAKHRMTKCKRINPFLNSSGLKEISIPQSPFFENQS